ncbi:MAG: DUF1853 family protein [Pseudomonadota bacterium]
MQVLTTDEAVIQQLTHPQVRDLAWACFSQALLVRTESVDTRPIDNNLQAMFAMTPQRLQTLQELDSVPHALENFLSQKSGRRRLGIYFEHLIEFFLLNDPDTELMVRNLAVRDDTRTLGEFDFVYADQALGGLVVHLEIALKFYMGLPESMTPSPARRWLGPGSHDALEDKIEKTLTHQSRLANSIYGRKALESSGVPFPHIQRVVIAGELFEPQRTMTAPLACLSNHHRGKWVRVEVLGNHIRTWHKAALLSKADWLTPLPSDFLNDHGVGTDKLQQQVCNHFAESQFPVMIEGIDQNGLSFDRTFVVPPSWPGR